MVFKNVFPRNVINIVTKLIINNEINSGKSCHKQFSTNVTFKLKSFGYGPVYTGNTALLKSHLDLHKVLNPKTWMDY